MQVEISTDDLQVVPAIGPGGVTREIAHRKVLEILERVAAARSPRWPDFDAGVLDVWRHGAIDDTVTAPPFVWTIYEYPEGEDPRQAAMAWLHEFAAVMASTGLDAQVATLPGTDREESSR
jgi:hypothetical protein